MNIVGDYFMKIDDGEKREFKEVTDEPKDKKRGGFISTSRFGYGILLFCVGFISFFIIYYSQRISGIIGLDASIVMGIGMFIFFASFAIPLFCNRRGVIFLLPLIFMIGMTFADKLSNMLGVSPDLVHKIAFYGFVGSIFFIGLVIPLSRRTLKK